MTDATLVLEQSDMRKRWSDPAYRLLYGSVGGAVPNADFTLNAVNITAEDLYNRIDENYEQFKKDLH